MHLPLDFFCHTFLCPENRLVDGEVRERILTTSKALRTALKMLTLVERGETLEELFIKKKNIPKEVCVLFIINMYKFFYKWGNLVSHSNKHTLSQFFKTWVDPSG